MGRVPFYSETTATSSVIRSSLTAAQEIAVFTSCCIQPHPMVLLLSWQTGEAVLWQRFGGRGPIFMVVVKRTERDLYELLQRFAFLGRIHRSICR